MLRSYYAWSREIQDWIYLGSTPVTESYIRALRDCNIPTATVHHNGR